ncbi:MAG: AarF/UbiB family protein [Lachnospiraceae bacterium]|nr:AarF/UbiB family protein [Lachnospiraceae bacterium]
MNNRETDTPENKRYGSRFREMTAVLRKHEITQGLTPEKLRMILEDLGPTYIKLGQIMSLHSDILPKEYCDELNRLHSEVTPMPFHEVEEVLTESLGYPWKKILSEIDVNPLGSASIAQVHKAVLRTGETVVIKVQRKGIYEVMSRDIALLHKAVKLIPPISIKEMVDFDMVLDELWLVTLEEMDFLKEAANMEEFARRNKEVAFVETPVLYREFTTPRVLVMEYIEGYAVDDKKGLLSAGYDLNEIGSKLVDNYIRQVMEDGFFHADPHPGNIRVRGGKIVWIDMGMMGRLTESDKEEIGKAIQGMATNDIGMIQKAVMTLGEFRGSPDQSKLYEDINTLMMKYGHLDMGKIDIAEVMQELMEIMKANKISMPHGLTMLARGLTHMEGVLADISPDINMVEIAAARLKAEMMQHFDWKKEMKRTGKSLYRSANKAIELPAQLSEFMDGYMKGQTRLNMDLHVTKDLSELLRRLVRNIVMGLWVMALLISSSIICTTDMTPQIWGIPAIGVFGYIFAFLIVLYVFLKHFFSRNK